jgi:hypothetical protein
MKVKDHYNADCAKLLSQNLQDKEFVKYIDKFNK